MNFEKVGKMASTASEQPTQTENKPSTPKRTSLETPLLENRLYVSLVILRVLACFVPGYMGRIN